MAPDPRMVRLLKTGWRWFRWRGLLLVGVFALGLAAFVGGAEVSDRAGVPDAPLLAHVYYTLGLFVLGGMDLGVPSGGPRWAQVALWCVYFGAPAITTSALVEGLMRAIRSEDWTLRWVRGHTVVIGAGLVAALTVRRVRSVSAHQRVVVVVPPGETPVGLLARGLDPYVQLLEGEPTEPALLEALRLHRARRVLALAADDFANLDTAAAILTAWPELAPRLVVHLSDLRLVRAIDDSPILDGCEVFNSHRIAASHLVHTRLIDHFHKTEPRDVVVLAGFGRLGQTVLDELQRHALGSFERVIIIDTKATHQAAIFDEQLGFAPGYTRDVWDASMEDPDMWRKLSATLKGTIEPVFLLGTDDDHANMQAALKLADRFPDAYVVTRCNNPSPFTAHLSKAFGFEVFDASEQIFESLPEDW